MKDSKSEEVTFVETKLNVPYYSQYNDVRDGDHRLRACGMTCAYMALKFFEAPVPTLDEMIGQGMQRGGFGDSGWIHDYFVSLFKSFGLACERYEGMRDRDVEQFRQMIHSGNPVIVSVARRMFDQRQFHQVLLTGVRESEAGALEGFFYHDPASLRQEGARHLYVPLPTFYLDWRHMAIFPQRP